MRNAADILDVTFAALADPTRRAILDRLASGGALVTELSRPFSMTQHYRRLWEANFRRLDHVLKDMQSAASPRRRASLASGRPRRERHR